MKTFFGPKVNETQVNKLESYTKEKKVKRKHWRLLFYDVAFVYVKYLTFKFYFSLTELRDEHFYNNVQRQMIGAFLAGKYLILQERPNCD